MLYRPIKTLLCGPCKVPHCSNKPTVTNPKPKKYINRPDEPEIVTWDIHTLGQQLRVPVGRHNHHVPSLHGSDNDHYIVSHGGGLCEWTDYSHMVGVPVHVLAYQSQGAQTLGWIWRDRDSLKTGKVKGVRKAQWLSEMWITLSYDKATSTM